MKTLIINGSPHKNGDTAFLVSELRKYLKGDVIELFAYDCNIKPCKGCKICLPDVKCNIKDDMKIIYNDDFDNIVIASSVQMTSLSVPILAIISRLQKYYLAKYKFNKDLNLKAKNGSLILTGGGGEGNCEEAVRRANWTFKLLNASFDKEKDTAKSLKTDTIPASEDEEAINKVRELAEHLNANYANQLRR
jgi:multimeric flavodoxin WrbA